MVRQSAASYSSLGASNNYAWLGVENDSNNAWYVNSNGNVNNNNRGNSYVVAPAFMILPVNAFPGEIKGLHVPVLCSHIVQTADDETNNF